MPSCEPAFSSSLRLSVAAGTKDAAVAGSKDQPVKKFRVPGFQLVELDFKTRGIARWANDMRFVEASQ
jgi:hypothetical protein